MAFCENCGKSLHDGARFCGACGAVVPEDKVQPDSTAPDPPPEPAAWPCPACGAENEAEVPFCSHCGRSHGPSPEAVGESRDSPTAVLAGVAAAQPSTEAADPAASVASAQASGASGHGRRARVSQALRTPWVIVLIVVLMVIAIAASVLAVAVNRSNDQQANRRHESPATAAATTTQSAQPQAVATTTPAKAARAIKTIGRSVEGREIVCIQFGTGNHRVLILGGVHGNEFGGSVARKFATYLQSHPAAVPGGTRIDVIPCLNPDGVAHDTRANARRVDLNRNLPTKNWLKTLSMKDLSGQLHLSGGMSAGSEPETKALLDQLDEDFAAVISLHSRGGILDYNGPDGRQLALRMSALCDLPLDHVAYQAYITGSMGDYVPWRYRIPLITVELADAQLTPGMRLALLSAATWQAQ